MQGPPWREIASQVGPSVGGQWSSNKQGNEASAVGLSLSIFSVPVCVHGEWGDAWEGAHIARDVCHVDHGLDICRDL